MALPVAKPQSNYQKCREAYIMCDGDHEAAKMLLLSWVAEDEDLRDYLLTQGADQLVRTLTSHERHSRIRSKLRIVEPDDADVEDDDELLTASSSDNADDLYAMVASDLRSLMEYPLAGGLRLKDATRDDLLRNAQKMFMQANEMMIRGRWLHLIAERMRGDAKVADVLSDDDLTGLLERATGV